MNDDEAELRRRNRAAVAKYLRSGVRDRRNRYTLYTEEGTASLCYADLGRPVTIRGRDRLRRHDEVALRLLPDWRWYDVEFFDTQNPDLLWVECEGEGRVLWPGRPARHYRNHFVHRFTLENGRIASSHEFANPLDHMRSLIIEPPHVTRDWLPP
ncbi:PhzA/PhzB family protein [Streptomyces sp. NPDC003077]|uniref:PhzA/PhzB family protein n=1 Tax=Streptomyces sp. NPDC003077 TaxID=3154443 RepID=UPI0033A9E3BA